MRGVFVDANESLADDFRAAEQARRSRRCASTATPTSRRTRCPALLDGAEIVDRRSHRAADRRSRKQCTGLKHVVFLGTGARSYMNPEELAELGIAVHLIKGYGDTAVAECAIALMWAAARGIAADGPRDARRQLAARGRHAAHRQDARPDRLRRHRRGSRAHRARQRHARDRLEPVAEEISRRRIRRARQAAGAKATSSRCICC